MLTFEKGCTLLYPRTNCLPSGLEDMMRRGADRNAPRNHGVGLTTWKRDPLSFAVHIEASSADKGALYYSKVKVPFMGRCHWGG